MNKSSFCTYNECLMRYDPHSHCYYPGCDFIHGNVEGGCEFGSWNEDSLSLHYHCGFPNCKITDKFHSHCPKCNKTKNAHYHCPECDQIVFGNHYHEHCDVDKDCLRTDSHQHCSSVACDWIGNDSKYPDHCRKEHNDDSK